MNNPSHLAIRTQPNGTVFFTNTLTGKNYFPCDERGNPQDITTNALNYVKFVRSVDDNEINSLDGFEVLNKNHVFAWFFL